MNNINNLYVHLGRNIERFIAESEDPDFARQFILDNEDLLYARINEISLGFVSKAAGKVGSKLSKIRKSFYRTKGEKAASKAKLKAHMDASDAQSAKSTAEMEGKEKADAAAKAAAKAAEAKAEELRRFGPQTVGQGDRRGRGRGVHPDSAIAGRGGGTGHKTSRQR